MLLILLVIAVVLGLLYFVLWAHYKFSEHGGTENFYGRIIKDEQRKRFDTRHAALTLITVPAAIVLMIVGIVATVDNNVGQPNRDKLLTLQDGRHLDVEARAGFFVSNVKVGDEFKYTFYYEGSQKDVGLVDVPTNRAIIYQDIKPGEEPYVEQQWNCDREDVNLWIRPTNCIDPNDLWIDYELHIPENTILQTWTLDGE